MTARPSISRSVALPILFILLVATAPAQNARFTEREVSFANGGVELKGTFIAPVGGGKHPAVVFLHGSGPVTRDGARQYAEEFAKLGLASLLFDKRGSGASGGSWITSSLADLSADALAAVAWLKSQDGIDPARIGFWGVSQAGWVASLAASQSRDVAFMVIISGGGVKPRDSERYSYDHAFDKAGFSEADRKKGFEILDRYFDYLSTGEGRAALLDTFRATQTTTLAPLVEQLEKILPSDSNRHNWEWVATWNPAASIAAFHGPALLLFGERDTEFPTAEAVRAWEAGLKASGNTRATVMVFPGAGHGIRMREGFKGSGRPPFAPGYAEVMTGWLWRHVIEK